MFCLKKSAVTSGPLQCLLVPIFGAVRHCQGCELGDPRKGGDDIPWTRPSARTDTPERHRCGLSEKDWVPYPTDHSPGWWWFSQSCHWGGISCALVQFQAQDGIRWVYGISPLSLATKRWDNQQISCEFIYRNRGSPKWARWARSHWIEGRINEDVWTNSRPSNQELWDHKDIDVLPE